MNLLSFVDELVKVGAVRCMYKRGADMNSSEIPAGMMDPAPAPPAMRVVPTEAATRVRNAHLPSAIEPGAFGPVTTAKKPIDQDRFNRPFVEHR